LDRAPSSTVPTAALQWDTIRRLQRVQVFCANEGAGRDIVFELLRAGHPPGGLQLYGRRPGQVRWGEQALTVGPIHGNTPPADLAFVCTNVELGSKLIPILQTRGTRVIDLSGTHHADEHLPLVLADLNPQEIGAFAEVVAIPSGTVALLAPVLASLDRVVGLAAVDGFVQLATQGRLPEDPCRFEQELARDTKRILGRPDLPLDLMVVEGGHERCDTFALKLLLMAAVERNALLGLLQAAPGIHFVEEPTGPDPARCLGSAEIHVGRIRAGSRGAVSVCCLAVGDQLRAGSAQAALRVACQMPAGA